MKYILRARNGQVILRNLKKANAEMWLEHYTAIYPEEKEGMKIEVQED